LAKITTRQTMLFGSLMAGFVRRRTQPLAAIDTSEACGSWFLARLEW
jgi:hypothetical protein